MAVLDEMIEKATAEFMKAVPEFEPYNVAENFTAMHAYINEQWGADSQAVADPSAWEIAFRAIKHELRGDDDYVSPELRAEIANMSGGAVHERYRRDPIFRKAWDTIAKEESVVKPLSPWKWINKTQYLAISPVQRAQLWAHDEGFRAAVQKNLIDEGLI